MVDMTVVKEKVAEIIHKEANEVDAKEPCVNKVLYIHTY